MLDPSGKLVWEGREYTVSELARSHGMLPETLKYRLKTGVPLEEAVMARRLKRGVPRGKPLTPRQRRGYRAEIVSEVVGESDTVEGWARETGIDADAIRRRLRAGWSADEALGFVQRERSKAIRTTARLIDWDGKRWTVPALAERHGISAPLLRWRLDRGWPLDEALAPPIDRLTASNGETDSYSGWSRRLGIAMGTLRTRKRQGWSADEILGLAPRQEKRHVPRPNAPRRIEWRGKVYPSLSALAAEHGMPVGRLGHRLANGWDLERALTEPTQRKAGRK